MVKKVKCMRIFIGISFKKEIREYLSEVQDIIRLNTLKGNFTKFSNFHITLRFLGELNQHQVDECCDSLEELSGIIKKFPIRIGDLNSFSRKNKHIVYVEVIKNKNELIKLVGKLDQIIDNYGFLKRAGKFKPHITIARKVQLPEVSVLKTLTNFDKDILIDQVTLFLSHRVQNQLVYTPLYSVKLNDN